MSSRDEKYEAFVKEDTENNRARLINNVAELKVLLDNPKIAEIITKNNLEKILTYATVFSDFYKPYAKFKSIKDFPIVDKQVLKDNWDKIEVKEYVNCSDNKIKYTSGSTGTPFKMILDKFKHCRWIAENKVLRELVGVKSHEKTVFVSDTVEDKKIPLERMEKDNVYYVSCKYYDDASTIEFVKSLYEKEVRTFTSMASYLDNIARVIVEKKAPEWKGNLIAIFSVSEHLKEHTRKIISEYFHCPVYCYYANEENGGLAIEDGSGFGYRANNIDFYFEVLNLDNDEPVKEGEIGRLVITDLFNKYFPIIRYANGDLVSLKKLDDGRLYFKEIAGRIVDTLYTTDKRPVHYFDSISFLEPYTDIKQFQLIQETYNDFTWVLNTKNHRYEDMIIKECRELFGEDTNYKFVYTDEIPKLRSGKFRMTVCNIKNV